LWSGPLAAAGNPAVLRARYPLVSALLRELAAQSKRDASADRRWRGA
jgi:hypothetical protein